MGIKLPLVRSLGGLGCEGLDAGVEAALVAGGGVVVEDALLDALVEGGGGEAELLLSGLVVALGDGLAQAAEVAADASQLYARNVLNFLGLIVKNGALTIDLADEVLAGACVAHQGSAVNPRVAKLLDRVGLDLSQPHAEWARLLDDVKGAAGDLEQAGRGGMRHRIARLRRQHCRNEDLERILLLILGDLLDRRLLEAGHRFAEPPHDRVDPAGRHPRLWRPLRHAPASRA